MNELDTRPLRVFTMGTHHMAAALWTANRHGPELTTRRTATRLRQCTTNAVCGRCRPKTSHATTISLMITRPLPLMIRRSAMIIAA